MENLSERRTWEVRVYAADSDVDEIAKWIIENVTEAEATSVASADIDREYPFAGDWTLMPL